MGELVMTEKILDFSMRNAAIVSGISILIMTLGAIMASDVTIGTLVVQGDVSTTYNNIIENEYNNMIKELKNLLI